MKQINYKEDYKRLKAKENFWAMMRMSIFWAGLFIYVIMR